jgi:hypothetical protein
MLDQAYSFRALAGEIALTEGVAGVPYPILHYRLKLQLLGDPSFLPWKPRAFYLTYSNLQIRQSYSQSGERGAPPS